VTPHSLQKNQQLIEYQPRFASPIELLEYWTSHNPNKPALVFDSYSNEKPLEWSYTKLLDLVRQTQAYLLSESNGNSIAFCFSNTPEVILLNFTCWSCDKMSVPLDSTRDTTERKIYKIQQAKSSVLFTRSDQVTKDENIVIQKAIPKLKIVEVTGIDEFLQLVTLRQAQSDIHRQAQRHTEPVEAEIAQDVPALILYTSGTTALPKGAVLTWKSLLANAESIADWLQFTAEDRWLVVMPLHHINSTTFATTTLLRGGTIVLVPAYSKSKFWPTLARHQVTGTSIVPTIAFDQLSEITTFTKHADQLSQMTRIQIGSAPVQPTTVKQFVDTFKIKLCQGYGQTETSLRSTGVPMDLTADQYLEIVESNSVGTELTFTNVTILKEDGAEAEANEVGEICVRGPIIMQKYLGNTEATAAAFQFNWFHSGDLGYWQEHFGRRFFFLKGRSKEIIKRGGVLISPLAIENALLQHYSELKQIYVIGYPDPRMGEEIGFVAISDDSSMAERILADAKDHKINQLKEYELPKAGLMIAEDQLPLTSTGKVQRVEIKKQFEHSLQQQTLLIAETSDYIFRLLAADETKVLKQAVAINNERWGEHLAATLEEFSERAAHGILIGMFDRQDVGRLLGTVSGVQLPNADITQIGAPNHWANSWNGITDHGRLYHSTHKGDCLVAVAISVVGRRGSTSDNSDSIEPKRCPDHTLSEVETYCRSGQDPVLSFHAKPKAGLGAGAAVQKIVPNGRPADWEACGYSVIMEYPPLTQAPTISNSSSKGTQLLESAFVYAFQHNLAQVYAYSRPAGLQQHLTSSLS
jgi:acyl-CoA synthetase (AMP-forming)/AMP-acid ligase II